MNKVRHWPLSAYILILVNLIPLFGVFFLKWNVLEIVLLYWAESAIIGFYNVLKMLFTSGKAKLFAIPFFITHFGGFMVGHFIVIVAIFLPPDGLADPLNNQLTMAWETLRLVSIPLATLFLSHGASFYFNFILKREYERIDVGVFMAAPYSRILIMQFALILGSFIIAAIKEPAAALILLILFKIIFDLNAHLREHKKLGARALTKLRT